MQDQNNIQKKRWQSSGLVGLLLTVALVSVGLPVAADDAQIRTFNGGVCETDGGLDTACAYGDINVNQNGFNPIFELCPASHMQLANSGRYNSCYEIHQSASGRLLIGPGSVTASGASSGSCNIDVGDDYCDVVFSTNPVHYTGTPGLSHTQTLSVATSGASGAITYNTLDTGAAYCHPEDTNCNGQVGDPGDA